MVTVIGEKSEGLLTGSTQLNFGRPWHESYRKKLSAGRPEVNGQMWNF
jgi:hypothetical protein